MKEKKKKIEKKNKQKQVRRIICCDAELASTTMHGRPVFNKIQKLNLHDMKPFVRTLLLYRTAAVGGQKFSAYSALCDRSADLCRILTRPTIGHPAALV